MRRGSVAVIVLLALGGVACGGSGSDGSAETTHYEMPAMSMEPTIELGEILEVDEAAYESAPPASGDVVVFHPPVGAERPGPECAVGIRSGQICPEAHEETLDVLFVKRIVAGPGDRLSLRAGNPVVNGEAAEEPYIRPCSFRERIVCDFPEDITIPEEHYFVMGDNRAASFDSRFWGPIPAGSITGKVVDPS